MKRNVITNMPLEVSVEITNVCNFKCLFCPQSNPQHLNNVGKNYLSVQNARIILKKIREFGYTQPMIHWTLDGEPFMNKSFHEISRIGKEFNFTNQYFATNAALLTKKNVELLPKDVNYTFTVDYCADKDTFEKIRGTKDSWNKIKENIIRIVSDEKIDNVRFNIADITSYDNQEKSLLKISKKKLESLLPRSKNIKIVTKTFHNATGYSNKELSTRKKKYNLCPYPWSSMMIASNGDVVICCRDLQHKTVLGNIFVEKLHDIWNGHKYRSVRENLINEKPYAIGACKYCDMPYDENKFSLGNVIKTGANRLQLMK